MLDIVILGGRSVLQDWFYGFAGGSLENGICDCQTENFSP